MKSSINQPPGTYAAMEQEWANTITNNGNVSNVKITIKYEDPNFSNRPTKFEVNATVNGNVKFYEHFN